MNVPNKFKREFQPLDRYSRQWLAREMLHRLGGKDLTIKAAARIMNLREGQILSIAQEYTKTFEVWEVSNRLYISVV
jgi:hypothetical protein